MDTERPSGEPMTKIRSRKRNVDSPHVSRSSTSGSDIQKFRSCWKVTARRLPRLAFGSGQNGTGKRSNSRAGARNQEGALDCDGEHWRRKGKVDRRVRDRYARGGARLEGLRHPIRQIREVEGGRGEGGDQPGRRMADDRGRLHLGQQEYEPHGGD